MNKTTKTLSLAVAMFAITGMTGAFSTQSFAQPGEEGCSSGFWKNDASKRGEATWDDTNFDPDDKWLVILSAELDPITIRVKDGPGKPTETSDPTLLQMLNARGGGVNALAREAVAALLNESNPEIDYPLNEGEIIDLVNDALPDDGDSDVEEARAALFEFNHFGETVICPLTVG